MPSFYRQPTVSQREWPQLSVSPQQQPPATSSSLDFRQLGISRIRGGKDRRLASTIPAIQDQE